MGIALEFSWGRKMPPWKRRERTFPGNSFLRTKGDHWETWVLGGRIGETGYKHLP